MPKTEWTARNLPDLTGRTAVVTGATSGIGLVAARELARAGAQVTLAVRDPAKGARVAADLPGQVQVRRLDVADLRSVREFAREWTGPLDLLINNAGIMQVPLARTADGFESQAATNYFGPFALTGLLLPQITGRVVTISSQLHRRGRLHTDDLNWERRKYNPTGAYCDSKLCATMFALELDRRLTAAGSRVRSLVAHPGIAPTNLVAHVGGLPGLVNRAMAFMVNDVERAALPTLYAATEDVPGGSYIGPDGLGSIKGHPAIGRPAKAATDQQVAARLWEVTAALTGIDIQLPDSTLSH
ncbi:MAG TPA: oxidoreductase [Actinocrinis sp.]|nr:oxidoreductase [Actinocrinis sp.]